jgi:TolB-like protein
LRPQSVGEWNGPESPVTPRGVVVLPFENNSPVQADAYLSEGFSDELRRST